MAETAARKKPGPPKTKDYTTFSLKLPSLLLDQIKRYAHQHRQSVSELFREGVEWRISEGDLLAQRYGIGDSTEHGHLGNPEIPYWTDRESESEGVLEEIRTTLARQETQLQALTQALENRPGISMPSEYLDTIMEALIRRQSTPEPVQEGNGQHAPQEVPVETGNTGLQGSTKEPDKPDKAGSPFDPTKYVLGELCQNKHDYAGTGQSLRLLGKEPGKEGECRECKNARSRAYKERQRQAKSQPQPA